MASLAVTERAALAALLDQTGPDRPTLCEGWTTRDLAAHLVVRAARPDAAIGIVVGPLSGHTESVRLQAAARPYAELVADAGRPAPWWNPMRLGPVDDAANSLEYLVHHEDVRRGVRPWEPRELPAEVQDDVWRRLGRMARLSFRSAPVGVVLRRPDGQEIVAKTGERAVTLTGDPVELVLYAFGRTECRIEFAGDPEAVAALRASKRGV